MTSDAECRGVERRENWRIRRRIDRLLATLTPIRFPWSDPLKSRSRDGTDPAQRGDTPGATAPGRHWPTAIAEEATATAGGVT
jgi:hypothetical protein